MRSDTLMMRVAQVVDRSMSRGFSSGAGSGGGTGPGQDGRRRW